MPVRRKTADAPSDPHHILFEDCWAKTTDGCAGMPVLEHCRIVGAVARELLKRLPECVVRVLPEYTATIAACHDVGKVSPGFQKKIAPERSVRIAPGLANQSLAGLVTSHAEISQAAVNRFLAERFTLATPAAVVGAHHGFWQTESRTDDKGAYGGQAWKTERRRLLDELIMEFGPLRNDTLDFATRSALAGLVTVADWIGSDEESFAPGGLAADTDLPRLVEKAVTECGWRVPEFKAGLSFKEIFGGREAYPVQKEFIEAVTGPGLYVLEAPMGCGKTEAALYAAYRLMAQGHNAGLYFGLPTRLTSDKIHERVEEFLGRICPDPIHARLAHGLAWLKEFEHGGKGFEPHGRYFDGREAEEPDSSWFNPAKRALLWPFAVGTIDQALMSVVRVKHHFLRTFGLAGKVVILDEVHSYDMYTGSLIETLVKQLLALRCTVIVLSATLTGERRARITGDISAGLTKDYPLITRKIEESVLPIRATAAEGREYDVSMANMDAKAVAVQAVEQADRGCCVMCIANTVEHAQRWYDAVKAGMPDGSFDVGLLHSKFLAFRRDDLEAEWLAKLGKNSTTRPKGCVLVATQVVEQSVDIDADYLITELAPTDMLLQRMGRVWRHEETVRPPGIKPTIRIVCGDVASTSDRESLRAALGEKSCFVYQPYVLWRTWQVWHGRSSAALPDDIRKLIDTTYSDLAADETRHVEEMKARMEIWRKKLCQYAEASLADKRLQPKDDDEDVTTRYSDRPMQDVLLVRSVVADGREATLDLLDGAPKLHVYADRKDFNATKRLHRQLLSVPKYLFKRLGMPKMPSWLGMHFHAPTPIWELRDEFKSLTMGGNETGFTYDKWRGLRRLAAPQAEPMPLDEYEGENPWEETE